MSIDINKHEVNIDTLFKQNELDLCSIKELYRKLKEIEKKITQIKYVDTVLADKLKKDYENLKRIILDENVQIEMINDINTINSQLDIITTVVNNADELKKAINENKKYILIKEGTHNIGTLTIKNPETTIKGKGIRNTVLNGKIIVPLSCHNTVIEDLRIDGNGYDVGIDLGKGDNNQVQDVGYILNKVRVVNSKIGITVNEHVRGCSLNNIIVGNCETGYLIYSKH